MRKLMAIWLILFLALSMGNVVPPVIAQEEQFEDEGADFYPPMVSREGSRRGRRPSNFRTMIQDEEEKVLNYLEENWPEEFERLTRLKKSSPLKYWEILRKKTKQMHFLERLKEKDPERYEKVVRIGDLERRSRQLAEEYRRAEEPEEKEELKADIKDLLNELFDLKQEEREAEMERLEGELKKLQENIIRRKENKETIVNRRLKEMSGEADYLQW